MVPKSLQKKFAGVQQPLGRWILRHVAEFIVLSPAILVTWLWLKLRHKEVLIVGRLSSTVSQFISQLEPELRRRLAMSNSMERTIVINLSADQNTQIRKMYNRVVKIYGEEARLKRRTIWWASQKGLFRKVLVEDQSDPMWVLEEPSISLTEQEENEGQEFLTENDLKKNEFLCYTVRTASYYEALLSAGERLRPNNIRNPDESIYLSVANIFASNDLKILRVGKDISPLSESKTNKNVIDYAGRLRSDFLDVYLMKYCRFAFVGNTGVVSLRWLWNLPNVHGDSYLIRRNQIRGDLFILQRVFLSDEGRLATFKEMLQMNHYSVETRMEGLGVRLVKNTVEEIKAVCDEMNARIDGTWVSTAEDEERQRRYQDLIVKYSNKPEWNGGGRIGTQFLRENQDLLRE